MSEEKKTNKTTEAVQNPGIDIEALKAQLLEEIRAEFQSTTVTTSTHTTTEHYVPKYDPDEEYVTVQLFKDGRQYKEDVYVSVNGENCVIKRGYPVQVKRKFALVLEQGQAQDLAAAEYAESRQREYTDQVQRFNL